MDYYSILEVEKTETKDGIKKAYRKLAMKYHPDRNKGDKEAEKKFKEVNEAYQVLGDEQKRKNYDMFGKAGANRGGNPFGGGGVDVDLWDIFESFFGGGFSGQAGTRRRTEQRGEDIEHTIHIDLKTSIYGEKQNISFKKRSNCGTCKGEGGSGKKTCSTCNGRGSVTKQSQTMFGIMSQTVVCPDCSGNGESFEQVCDECHGQKRVVENKTLEIDIPAGIDDGMMIKLTGEGNNGINTKASGDLYVRFSVSQEEKWLKRDGFDLHYNQEIEIVEAVLWAKKEISLPILGKRNIEIPNGSEHGTIIKLSNDGVKHIGKDQKWDLFIHLFIKILKKLAKKEKELYEEIAKERGLEVGNTSGFFDKLFG